MSALSGLGDWWQGRAPRERAMLGVMLLAVAAFALWLGAVRPLQHARDAAMQRHERAADGLREIDAAMQASAALQANRPVPPAGEAFERTILEAAAKARVPVARQRRGNVGMLEVGIDAVAAPALLGWLDGLRRRHGIAPELLDITERNGQLRVQATFKPPASR